MSSHSDCYAFRNLSQRYWRILDFNAIATCTVTNSCNGTPKQLFQIHDMSSAFAKRSRISQIMVMEPEGHVLVSYASAKQTAATSGEAADTGSSAGPTSASRVPSTEAKREYEILHEENVT